MRILGRTENAALIVAGLLDNYYTCLETVFLRISQFFENELSSDHWHADLLEKMTLYRVFLPTQGRWVTHAPCRPCPTQAPSGCSAFGKEVFWRLDDVSVMEKKIVKRHLDESQADQDLRYWLSRTARERIAAVELLRRQQHGSAERLQRIARVVERERG